MGIYISGVKGLPEQVQQNKEDIKTIQEEIEGIDFEQIRQLETQVGENTQDINTIENNIGLQSQAITDLNNELDSRASALESKTQLMTYNSDLSMTDFRNSIEVTDDVYASNVRVMGDGSIVNTSQSGMHFKEGANDDTLTIANNDGATPHYLHFNADGTLDIDGNAVGGGTEYKTVSFFLHQDNSSRKYDISFMMEEKEIDNITSYAQIRNKLYNSGASSSSRVYAANGYFLNASNEVNIVYGIYADGQGAGNSIVLVGYNTATLQRAQTLTTAANDTLSTVILDFNV